MKLEVLKQKMGDFAADIRLNLSSVLTPEGAPDLSATQIHSIALASAYATKHSALIEAIEEVAAGLTEEERKAARGAAVLMAMNNVYYRFTHLVEDPEFKTMPARLRMNFMARPGIPKKDFELVSTAVSAINGCGTCMQSHTSVLLREGVSRQAVQSAVRIASVIQATATALSIEGA